MATVPINSFSGLEHFGVKHDSIPGYGITKFRHIPRDVGEIYDVIKLDGWIMDIAAMPERWHYVNKGWMIEDIQVRGGVDGMTTAEIKLQRRYDYEEIQDAWDNAKKRRINVFNQEKPAAGIEPIADRPPGKLSTEEAEKIKSEWEAALKHPIKVKIKKPTYYGFKIDEKPAKVKKRPDNAPATGYQKAAKGYTKADGHQRDRTVAKRVWTIISVGFTILAACGYAMNIWEVMK